MGKVKIGRNSPCPCGSGKKYKKCCGFLSTPKLPISLQKHAAQKHQEAIAMYKQRLQQQGLGKPIISTTLNGNRVICVGNKVHSSTKWKTFHDFLSSYIKLLFSPQWGNNEIAKPYDERHPLLKIYDIVCRQQKEMAQTQPANGIYTGDMTGAISSYLWLSYNLYLIEHNKDIQNQLIGRLKHQDQFAGAYYETFVIAIFLRAGFLIEFEDEISRKSTHCEFTATHKSSGKKYTVEVKQRNRKSIISNKGSNNIELDYKGLGKLLKEALKKNSKHERIIFIDTNLPSAALEKNSQQDLQDKMVNFIRKKEKQLHDSPSAYLFLTNYPYHHEQDLNSTNHYNFVLLDGFKIDDFGFGETNLHQAIQSRKKHKLIDELFKTIQSHNIIPSTFDGSIPEFTFDKVPAKLKIGETYEIPDKDGNFVNGILVDCTVNVKDKKAHGLCQTSAGILLVSFDLSDAEINAYKKHPDTFFGIYKKAQQSAKTPLDLYDFFYDSFGQLTKEDLLSRLEQHPNQAYIKSLSQKELLETYCEAIVSSNWKN